MSFATPAALTDMTTAYDQEDYAAVALAMRSSPDIATLIEQFQSGGNPWPDRPEREAAFVLELTRAGLLSRKREDREAIRRLLEWYQPLLRGPLGPDAFEKYWLWACVALLEGGDDLTLADTLVTNALRRFPDEPRLQLARAFLLDRRRPNARAAATRTFELAPRAGISETPIAREETRTSVTRTTGLTAEHMREVSEAYDKAMAHADTRAEARIRKAWLLHRADRHQEALALLDSPETDSSDALLRYLRHMFQGRVYDALGLPEPAGDAYRAGQTLAPLAQSPKVALMAHALRRGDFITADRLATEVQSAPPQDWDPWWSYWQGDSRMFPAALSRLRGQTR
jgi:tetratricopeptide (TPR) repeat protein